MNTPATTSNTSPQKKEISDISSMLLPLQASNILLPGVAVAEIITFLPPEKDYDEEVPPWYLGIIYWRNQRVPLISYEVMKGAEAITLDSNCRIAVLNNTGVDELEFFAVVLQGTPRLLRLSPEDVSEDKEKTAEEGEKLHIRVAGEEAIVPDITYIEKMIVNYMKRS